MTEIPEHLRKRAEEARAKEAQFQQMLADAKNSLDKTRAELEAAKQKQQSTQTIIHQPPVIYHPPYHPRYYWPWW